MVQGINKLQCSHKQYVQQSLWIRQVSCRAATTSYNLCGMVCKNAAVQSFERHRVKHSLCNRLSVQRGLFVPIRRRSQMPVRACRQAVRLQSSFAIKKSNERVFCINSVVQGTNKLQCSHKQYFQQSLWIRQGSCRAATKNAKEIFFLLHWNRGAECENAAEKTTLFWTRRNSDAQLSARRSANETFFLSVAMHSVVQSVETLPSKLLKGSKQNKTRLVEQAVLCICALALRCRA